MFKSIESLLFEFYPIRFKEWERQNLGFNLEINLAIKFDLESKYEYILNNYFIIVG